MKASKSISWKGFDFRPQGCLLEQIIEESAKIGIAYERSCNFYKNFHLHDRPILVFPRRASRMKVRIKNPNQSFVIDHSLCLILPARIEHDDEGLSSIYDTFALLPEAGFISETGQNYHITHSNIRKFLSQINLIKRSERLNQWIQDYFFERIVAKNNISDDCRYLERKIIEEIFLILFQSSNDNRDYESAPYSKNENSITFRALQYIETNLFNEISARSLAKHCSTSVASLFRDFKKEVSYSPYSYIKKRRLEEAMALLKKWNRSVSEVALLVGYENFGAFSEAFKTKYKKSPSFFIDKNKN